MVTSSTNRPGATRSTVQSGYLLVTKLCHKQPTGASIAVYHRAAGISEQVRQENLRQHRRWLFIYHKQGAGRRVGGSYR